MCFHMACAVTNFDVRCDKQQVLADQNLKRLVRQSWKPKIVSVLVVVSTDPTFQSEEMIDEMQMVKIVKRI